MREFLRSELAAQPAAIKVPLGEAIEAADTDATWGVRKDALAAVGELKARVRIAGAPSTSGPDWRRCGRTGCVSAAALAGRASASLRDRGLSVAGLLSFWEKQQ